MKRALLILLVGCNDDVDLTGLYRVDSDVASTGTCGSEQAVVMPPVALKFAKAELFGSDYFYYEECEDLTGANCAGSGLFGNSFAEPIEGGWRGVVSSSSGVAPNCTISFTEQTATLQGTLLIVESTTYGEDVTTEAQCSTDEAEKRGASMPCASHERIEATKL